MNNVDAARELDKAADALEAATRHFDAEAQMNAALHMADTVRPAPLAAHVANAMLAARNAAERLRGEA